MMMNDGDCTAPQHLGCDRFYTLVATFFNNMLHMMEIEDAIVCSPVVRYTLTHRSENSWTHRSVDPWTVHDRGISNIRHNSVAILGCNLRHLKQKQAMPS